MRSTLLIFDFSKPENGKAAELYFSKSISPERLKYIQKRGSGKAYRQSVIATGLLEEFLRERGYGDISYRYSKNGKPYFAADDAPFFSLSHSGTFVAAAVSYEPVGIDIEDEAAHGKADVGRLAKRFFSPDEAGWIEDDKMRFLTAWTYKEAYAKAYDMKLAANLSECEYEGIREEKRPFFIGKEDFGDCEYGRRYEKEFSDDNSDMIPFCGTGFVGCLLTRSPKVLE